MKTIPQSFRYHKERLLALALFPQTQTLIDRYPKSVKLSAYKIAERAVQNDDHWDRFNDGVVIRLLMEFVKSYLERRAWEVRYGIGK